MKSFSVSVSEAPLKEAVTLQEAAPLQLIKDYSIRTYAKALYIVLTLKGYLLGLKQNRARKQAKI